ncbi:MAG: methylisocitrate lyase [Sulfolobales archaeon]|jgi:methylisocitrate lyase
MSKVKISLRDLIRSEDILVVPGVYAPSVAMLAEKLGFKAVYLSGAALTGLLGIPDLGIITLTEVALFTRYITSKISIPLIVDADTGFGEVLNVERAVRELEDAGASAIQIEDQVLPKKCGHLPGKEVIPVEEMVEKIIMATKTRRSKDFLIIARTDARAVEGLEKAIERAKIYVEAGADIIFPEALESKEEFEIFAKKVDAPLLANMTEFGKSPLLSVKELKDLGYKIVLFPVTTFRASMKASEKILKIIMEKGTQREDLDMLMTRSEFYELIKYHDYEKKDELVSKLAKDLMARKRSLMTQ